MHLPIADCWETKQCFQLWYNNHILLVFLFPVLHTIWIKTTNHIGQSKYGTIIATGKNTCPRPHLYLSQISKNMRSGTSRSKLIPFPSPPKNTWHLIVHPPVWIPPNTPMLSFLYIILLQNQYAPIPTVIMAPNKNIDNGLG